MNKASYIEKLYIELKDKIEFDEDVEALYNILKKLLKINQKKSLEHWFYIMQKYSLKNLEGEIDFTPLTTKYILELLKYNDMKHVLKILKTLSVDNSEMIKNKFFNVFDKKSGIYKYIKKLIIKKEQERELATLALIIEEMKGDIWIFDSETLLKNTILIHLKSQEIDISFLLKITNLAKSKKDKALLQALLIDYI